MNGCHPDYNELAATVVSELGAGREHVANATGVVDFWCALRFFSDTYSDLSRWLLDDFERDCLDEAVRIALRDGAK